MSKTIKSIDLTQLIARAFKLRRFQKNEEGVTAIEFGLLALPFFAIIGAIIETSLVFLASQILDSAVHDSARFIRTGQAHTASYTASSFRTAICDSLYGLFDCDQIKIKVSEVANFGAASLNSVVDVVDGSWTVVEIYDHGAGNSVILVEAYYKWPVTLDLFSFNLSNLPDNTRMLSAVRVFRNEPF